MEVIPPPFARVGDMAGLLDTMPDPTPTSLQIFAIFIIIFFPALALVVVLIRVAGRLATSQFGWDDWLISMAMLLSVAETIISFFFIKTNFIGIHMADIPVRDPTEALIWSFAVQILYNPIISLVKSSVLLFLLRLFGQKTGVRRFIIILNTINIAQMLGTLFAVIFQCSPIQFNWDPTLNGTCIDVRILFTFTSSFNILTDLLVLGLPIWIFIDLKIPRRAKIGLLFVFLLGFLVTIASVVRLVIFVQGLFGLTTSDDPTFNIGFVTSAIETNLAVITASAPALRPIFKARNRGGWWGRFTMTPPKSSPDLESGGEKKSAGWRSDTTSASTPTTASRIGRKFGRGGSRGGRRGGRSGRGRGGAKKYDIRIRRSTDATPLRSRSPRGSEEEMMTANGVMRVSDIQREIDGIVKEIAVTGEGTYTGVNRTGSSGRGSTKGRSATVARSLTRNNESSRTNGDNTNYAYKSAATSTPGSRDSNINNFRNTGFEFFMAAAAADEQSTRKDKSERYYSESVYPDMDFAERQNRDYSEERISKYGDKRFGVVTPKGTTPTSRGWRDEGGRPF